MNRAAFDVARRQAARLGMTLTYEKGVLRTYYLLHVPDSQGDIYNDLFEVTSFLRQAERTDRSYARPSSHPPLPQERALRHAADRPRTQNH